jgi:hypothetical protein
MRRIAYTMTRPSVIYVSYTTHGIHKLPITLDRPDVVFKANRRAGTPSPDSDSEERMYVVYYKDTFSTEAGRKREVTYTTDDTVEPLLEPRDGLVLLDLVLETDSAVLVLLSGNSGTGSAHNNVAGRLVRSRKYPDLR